MKLLGVILGLLDLNAAILLVAIALGVKVPTNILIIIPVALFLKACISLTDIGSVMDLFVMILIVLSIFLAVPAWILYIGAVIIGFKGLRSFGI